MDILNVVVDNNSAAQRSVAAVVVVVESMDVGLVILIAMWSLLFNKVPVKMKIYQLLAITALMLFNNTNDYEYE